MATFLETGLLSYFAVIFPALLVFVVVFAILEKTKLLGENKGINGIIAIVCAFLVIASRSIVQVIGFMAPWFVLVFIFLILLLLLYKIMGATDENIANVILKDRPIQWVLFIVGAIIVIAALSHVFGPKLLPITSGENVTAEDTQSFGYKAGQVFFHPKVLGLLLIFAIAVFAVMLITRESI